MRKFISYLYILLILFSSFTPFMRVEAAISARAVAQNGLALNSEAKVGTKIASIPYNTIIEVLSSDLIFATDSGCSRGWYQAKYNGNVGYVCSTYISFYTSGNLALEREPVNDYEKEWKNLGFPSSYWESLTALKENHPNYTFEAIKTDLDWALAVGEESIVGKSLIQVTDLSSAKVAYISTAGGSYDYATKTYKVLEGATWYAADSRVVAYYMDPRNFLTESRVYMFEDLLYEGNYLTKDDVAKVFGSTFSNLSPHSQAFVTAGESIDINPIYLAVLSRQELGKGTMLVDGGAYIYPDSNTMYKDWIGKELKELYNFYNYGAGTDSSPAYNSLVYAFYQGWNTPELALVGGATKIGNGYIKKGQNTIYFKKFNVKPGAASSTYTHQYQTNIQAPFSEAGMTYNTYNDITGLLTKESTTTIKFQIPVYNYMPDKTELPTEVVFADNYGNTTIDDILATTLIKNDGTYLSGFDVGNTVTNITEPLSTLATEVVVYDASGNAKTEGVLCTGDKVKITYEDESQMYTVTIYGDTSGDGKVDIIDLLQVQKHILNATSLVDVYNKAGDNNQDGKIDIIDLLRVQKHILGQLKIVG